MPLATRALSAELVFDGIHLAANRVILLHEQQFLGIVAPQQVPSQLTVEHFADCVLSPGWLDLQLNGCGGVLFNDMISSETLEIMHQTNLRFGTVAFLPTLITSTVADMRQALRVVDEWMMKYSNQRGVVGLHLEGPFISCAKKGIHPAEYIQVPQPQLLAEIASYARRYPLKLTLAPEIVTPAQIEQLVQAGVIVAVGHTNASYEQAELAFKSGATAVTHMFNAMSGLIGRSPGVIGAVLAHNPYVGIIADLLHVAIPNLQLMVQLKPETTYLVTDAVTPSGTNLTKFNFAGQQLWVRDGRCVDAHGTLGGAYLTMNQALKNCVTQCQVGLEQALKMATSIPAQVIGIGQDYGQLKVGAPAHLIALNLHSWECQLV